ncbi:RNA-splicing ligase RtcB [Mycobacteroides abscessus subsp. massiliense]|uniref:RtcB family protein n=1 Tax=Mycobacteroides abscessus TaxID=36809 RepID=UPI0009A76079|nr:RtcB family protein [Mycobacteroides abscessus]SKU71513.1 RNA-splicing ligase RtcB [Mycobacteroides abscessus subsp. massiliense]SKV04052.1 RNA-splicing ligase RtcB [Mycobacteroides abscessus subsp. massiliense]
MQRINNHLINFASQIDDNTIEQAKETASMPFVHPHVALMPDAHSGKGSAVGTVIPTVGAVIPAAVGVDIGCGMIAARTIYTLSALEGRDLAELRKSVESAIPLSPGNYNKHTYRFPFTANRIAELEGLALATGTDLSHSPKWREQLGSLGGGNHFIELCVDERERVWLFLHSGSRGVGNKIAQKHIKIAQNSCFGADLPNRDLAYLNEGSLEFDDYIAELRWAQRFALLNRAEMMDRFMRAFAHWMGLPADSGPAIEVDRINTHHNYTTQELHGGQLVWLTRKGAIDARPGVMGLIPGSMGTRSYVVRGKGSVEGLCSAPHGAGRRFSRTKARQMFTADDLAHAMKGIEYRHGEAWVDEIPQAYKDIDQVMADASDLVEVVHELRQILNVKGQ